MGKNTPAATIRDGNIKAVLWKNTSENGVFISTTFAKTYDDGGKPKDSNSFVGTDVLRLAEVAREAYRVSNRLRREMNEAAKEQQAASEDAAPKAREHSL